MTADPTSGGAKILPFPRRADPSDADRLQSALARLEAALVAQRGAVSAWRHALDELRTSMGRLNDGVQSYQAQIAGIARTLGAPQPAEPPAPPIAPGGPDA
jgi:hypothetical protein